MTQQSDQFTVSPRVQKIGIAFVAICLFGLIAFGLITMTSSGAHAEVATDKKAQAVAEKIAQQQKNTTVTDSASADKRLSSEEIPSGVAVFETSKKCDVYVDTKDDGVLDWAVAKSKEFGCELRSLFTSESHEVTTDQTSTVAPSTTAS